MENTSTHATKSKDANLVVIMLICLLGIFLTAGIYLGQEESVVALGEKPATIRELILKQCSDTDDNVCTSNITVKVIKNESGNFSLEWEK
ncbi:MAG: hypothetical protein PHX25_03170 [Candidatus Pacebacteria bacterium]|nr:hypothetical protein [Candidatus Paceibacterota bacterium]